MGESASVGPEDKLRRRTDRRRRGRGSGRLEWPAGRRATADPAQLALDLKLPAPVHRSRHGTVGAEGRPDARGPRPGDVFFRSDIASAVIAFHSAFELPMRVMPSANVPPGLAELRIRLLAEEVDEFAAAARAKDLVGIADGLADIVYVAYGAAVTYGVDLDAVLAEVHRANMSKLDASGRPVLRHDGKVIKSARYRPPDVAGVLDQQLPLL